MEKRVLRNIMIEAHKIAKELEGDYQARLKMALKMVWEAVKDDTTVVSYKETRRKEWKKYGKHRIYIDGEIDYIVHKVGTFTFLKTKLGGYIDVQTGKFHISTHGGTWAVEAQLKAQKYIVA